MRLDPELSPRRARTVALDVAVVLAVVLFAWLRLKVYDAVPRIRSATSPRGGSTRSWPRCTRTRGCAEV